MWTMSGRHARSRRKTLTSFGARQRRTLASTVTPGTSGEPDARSSVRTPTSWRPVAAKPRASAAV
jgi:hypothetical protein